MGFRELTMETRTYGSQFTISHQGVLAMKTRMYGSYPRPVADMDFVGARQNLHKTLIYAYSGGVALPLPNPSHFYAIPAHLCYLSIWYFIFYY